MGLDEVSEIEHAFMILCLNFTLRVFKEVIQPLPEDTTDIYRERCRDRIAAVSGFKKYDSDYKDILAYTKQFKEFMRQRRTATAAQ
jgi:hypothetical protein